jgi:cell division protein FtsQ
VAVSPPADPRLRRSGPRSPAPAGGRPRWPVVVLGTAGLLVAIALGAWTLHVIRTHPAFSIRDVVVDGNRWVARGEVLALLGGIEGAHLMTVDLERWRRALLASPWVADATLRRTLPGTVTVRIAEREPVAIARIGADLYVIDRDAILVDRFGPAHGGLDLPIVDGIATSGADGLTIDGPRVAVAVALVHELRRWPDLAAEVSQIDVTVPDDTAVFLRGRPARVRVGRDRVADRLRTYLEIADLLHAEVPEVDYVDLRFGDRVYLKPLPPATGRAVGPPSGGRG